MLIKHRMSTVVDISVLRAETTLGEHIVLVGLCFSLLISQLRLFSVWKDSPQRDDGNGQMAALSPYLKLTYCLLPATGVGHDTHLIHTSCLKATLSDYGLILKPGFSLISLSILNQFPWDFASNLYKYSGAYPEIWVAIAKVRSLGM